MPVDSSTNSMDTVRGILESIEPTITDAVVSCIRECQDLKYSGDRIDRRMEDIAQSQRDTITRKAQEAGLSFSDVVAYLKTREDEKHGLPLGLVVVVALGGGGKSTRLRALRDACSDGAIILGMGETGAFHKYDMAHIAKHFFSNDLSFIDSAKGLWSDEIFYTTALPRDLTSGAIPRGLPEFISALSNILFFMGKTGVLAANPLNISDKSNVPSMLNSEAAGCVILQRVVREDHSVEFLTLINAGKFIDMSMHHSLDEGVVVTRAELPTGVDTAKPTIGDGARVDTMGIAPHLLDFVN